MATSKKVLNLNTAKRGKATDFVELVPVALLGPLGVAESTTTKPNINAVIWSIVPNMTTDLKNAIISFIDKNKSGKSIVSSFFEGRKKVIEFEFQGTPSNIYKFGEIGILRINLSYPPGSKTIATPLNPLINTSIATTSPTNTNANNNNNNNG
jgi:hypothetical protein